MAKKNTMQSTELSKHWLYLLTALFISFGYIIWQMWPSMITSGMQWQKEISNQLSELLYDAKTHLISAGLSLSALSFLYGVLHSLGPGHGKLIVTTYIATHPTKVKLSLLLTILSALLQAIVAILLVSMLLMIFHSSMHEVNEQANLFITLSFYIIILLGIVVVIRSIRFIYKEIYSKQKNIATNNPLDSNDHSATSENQEHTDSCGCGHKHFAGAKEINNASSFKEYLVIILSIGLRPCTGAIMVLLFANMVGIYWLGILSAFIMAIGTAITTSTIAMMTITGRQIVQGYLNAGKHSDNKFRFSGALIQLIGGLVLILMGAVLLGSQPVGMSPVF